MKQIVWYACEACGKQYPSEDDAVACERYHNHIKNIVSECFSPAGKYPNTMICKFSNDAVVEYRRSEVLLEQ